MIITLRDYQQKAHNLIYNEFKKGKSTLLLATCGAGKSITAASFIDKNKKNFKFVLMVRTRDLVFQLAKTLDLFNLDYSIFMAGENKKDSTIVICSIIICKV